MAGAAAMTPVMAATATWYLTRGVGTTALGLLTASVLLGILNWTRWTGPRWPRLVSDGLHRNVSLLAVSFVALHVACAVVDGYVPISVADAVIPFGSRYRPLWLGLGALALDLLLAVAITSLLRRRLGRRRWRAVHWLAYAAWPAALVHALGTGTDPRQAWFAGLAAACAAAVLGAVLGRIVGARSGPVHRRVALSGAGSSPRSRRTRSPARWTPPAR